MTVDQPENSIEMGQSDQELVSPKNGSRLKKRLCIALMMLVLVGLCVAALVYFGAIKPYSAATTGESLGTPISLENVLSGEYWAQHKNATWISSTELIYKDDELNILTFDVEANKTTVLANSSEIPVLKISFSAEISPDRQYLLLGRDYQKIYRHSGLARYDVLDLTTKEIMELSPESLQLAEWGPKGNSLIYIRGNNIFFKEKVSADELQITDDGEDQNIFNGICDWVYEEEVFSTKTAVWISPDNKKMAYVQFNDSDVFHIHIPVYGEAGYPQFQYPHAIDFSYPKTGSRNPYVKLFLVDLTSTEPASKKVQIQPPKEFSATSRQHIIGLVEWANNETLLTTWLNRVQNDSIVQICKNTSCQNLVTIKSPSAWLEMKHRTFNEDGSKFVHLASQYQKDLNDSYQHLTLVSMDTGKQTALTSGEFVVMAILHWDFNTNVVYYAANAKNAPHVKHIWSVKADENVDPKPICYTCNITRNGVPQTFFEASFSPNGKYIMLENAGPSIPRTDIVMIESTNSSDLAFVRNWEDNRYLKEILFNSTQPTVKYHQIKLKSGFEAFVKLQLPPGVDESSATKYPMLIDVYAGPNTFNGADRWDIGWNAYLATNRKYIIAQINGRGSGNRGDKLIHQIYRKMGTVEVEDQIETASKLADLFPFIDGKRIGIWGWSYGGFVSGMALAKDDNNVIRCGASVAPVTDWVYYDTIYTERFMGLPFADDNAIGYTNARLSTLYSKFVNKTYLLVHGTLDDNVHYQQSMVFARQLEVHDIPFEQITYPDEDHSLARVRRHLYHSLDRYFNKCFTQ